jgi:hypothetical protein
LDLHIVSFEIPYPADFGGVFDIFHKIRKLYEKGIRIHLHCFQKKREPQKELEKYCISVHYYTRNTGHKGISTSLPYIVSSRVSKELEENLLKDNFPILLEGIHCTYLLDSGKLKGRKVVVRLHNVEYDYYQQLAGQTPSLPRKVLHRWESYLLKKYERSIAQSDALLLGITEKDCITYRREFGAKNIAFLPAFIPWDSPINEEGIGTFCLYHGNLSVPENENVAIWLLEKIFNKLEIPFVIAGKDPSPHLQRLAHTQKHTCIVANPSSTEMQDLISKAQVLILPSFTNTGIKYKLLTSVFSGRHCVINDKMEEGSALGPACHIANSKDAFASVITQLYRKPYDNHEIQIRRQLLHETYNNEITVNRLIQWIFEHYQ